MRNVLRSAALAFSCFSSLPMPQVDWQEGNMRYMMCFFPLVGLLVGLAVAAWTWLSGAAGFGPVLFGAGVALVPIAVTGGIHLDGFCDVIDAQSSHAEPARKREIMSDPHIGAFAAIGAAVYLLAYAAVASELSACWQVAALLAGMHVASRCLSATATLAFPTAKSGGMLAKFHESAAGKRALAVVLVELAACIAALVAIDLAAGLAIAGTGLVCLGACHLFAKRQFGGMSGDIAGFFLQVAEFAMLCALVIAFKAVGF